MVVARYLLLVPVYLALAAVGRVWVTRNRNIHTSNHKGRAVLYEMLLLVSCCVASLTRSLEESGCSAAVPFKACSPARVHDTHCSM